MNVARNDQQYISLVTSQLSEVVGGAAPARHAVSPSHVIEGPGRIWWGGTLPQWFRPRFEPRVRPLYPRSTDPGFSPGREYPWQYCPMPYGPEPI